MANLSGLTPTQCAFILASKHFTALKNVLFRHSATANIDIIEEITGDLINYMLFIKILFMEESQDDTDKLGPVLPEYLSSSGGKLQMP
jgi:hypothetical protein